MGWSAVPEGVEEESEASTGLLRTDAQGSQDLFLDLPTVDSYRSGAQFPAVEDQVVGQRPDGQLVVTAEHAEVLLVGHGEGVMSRDGVPCLVVALEQREVRHPDKVTATFGDRGSA